MLIPKSVFHINRATSDDPARLPLANVHFYRDDHGLGAEACDGRSLIRISWTEAGDEAGTPKPAFSVLVGAGDCAKVLKIVPKSKRHDFPEYSKVEMAEAESNGNGSVFLRSLHPEGQRLEFKKPEADGFPDTSIIVKECREYPEEEAVRIVLSAERLVSMVETIQQVVGKEGSVILTIKRPGNKTDGTPEKYSTNAVVFEGGNEADGMKALALLMPIRTE